MTQVIDRKVFLDLDGVLVDFVSGALKSLGITNYKVPPGEYNIEKWEGVNISTKEFWSAIDKTNEYFWAELPKYPWADELVELCESYGQLFILTSPSRNPYCLAGKMIWVQKNFKKLQRKIILTPHKYLCAAPNRVLIDDSNQKCEDFDAYGGKTILFPQLWNTNHSLVDMDKIKYCKFILDQHFNI